MHDVKKLISLRDCTVQPQAVGCLSMLMRAISSGVGMRFYGVEVIVTSGSRGKVGHVA
jgi:hypothetical protein